MPARPAARQMEGNCPLGLGALLKILAGLLPDSSSLTISFYLSISTATQSSRAPLQFS
ncbi:hypothetical protein SLEP1_g28194 [Rubroshorea leprosula]|uniref:Uncharacterized protein n=1 Tax=Rubroshorea leprosula TaxID=152421 RepID=A0AAV5JVG9_9ROSI|nr:hypothetical protein SLEP1_g28194 [Rubroshorea leprosula]